MRWSPHPTTRQLKPAHPPPRLSAQPTYWQTTTQTMQMQMPMPPAPPPLQTAPHAMPHAGPQTPVVTTDVGDLAYTMDGSTKVYNLVAEVLRQKIHPTKTIDVWGFNGTAPGPT